MAEQVKIGWGRRDITTQEPTCIHGQFHIRISQGVLDPIYVTALAIESNGEQVVMVSCDATGLTGPTNAMIQERIKALVPEVDAAKVIVNCTHTHCTGDTNAIGMCMPYKDFPVPPEVVIQKPGEYQAFFAQACAEAVAEAWANRKPGALAWGYGYAVTSHSRKVWYFDDISKRPGARQAAGRAVDGHAAMYGNTNDDQFSHYEAGAEHTVHLMYTFDADQKLTGAVINIACPSQNSEGMEKLTADFWHDVRLRLAETYGDIRILPQCAPAGDLSPRILHGRGAQERRYRLKYADRPAAYQEEFTRKDIAERICAAFDEVLSWASKDIRKEIRLQNSLETLELQRRQSTHEEYDNEKVQYEGLMNTPFYTDGTPHEQFRRNSVLAACRERSAYFMANCERCWRGEPYRTILHAVTIDDIAFVTSPFELYMDFMHRIQARSPYLQTFNIQLCDNVLEFSSGYLATQRGVEGGGYSSSRYCNLVSPTGGQQLVDATVATLKRMHEA